MCGGRGFCTPIHGGRVVGEHGHGLFSYIINLHEDIGMGNCGCKFEVGVGKRASGVVVGVHGGLNRARKGVQPNDGSIGGKMHGLWEPHASHTSFGGVATTSMMQVCRDNFTETGRTVCHIVGEGKEVVELSTGFMVDVYVVCLLVCEGNL